MTYDSREISNHEGAPIALYQFVVGGALVYRYTSARREITALSHTWQPLAISDDGITLSGETDDDELVITMPSNAFTDLYTGTPPSGSVEVTIRRMHHEENEAPIFWTGTVKSVKAENALERKVMCSSLTSSLNRLGLRLTFSSSCPHTLYDLGCKVVPATYALSVQITSVTGNAFVHNGPISAGNYFAGGYVEFTAGGIVQRRPIESQVGNTINLLTPTDGITVGATVTLFPGCDRTTATCANKFNNLANYGGFPALPNKSPFNFDPVF